LSLGVAFSDSDADLLHNVAAQCHWAREECHPAILHLIKAYDLVKNSSAYHRRSVAIGNIGVILQELGEWDLALSASTEAWRLQLDHFTEQGEIQLTHLANIVRANCELVDYGAALSNAKLLLEYLASTNARPSWTIFESLCEAFALNGQVAKAQYCLDHSRLLNQANPTPNSSAMIQIGEAMIMEAKRDYDDALTLAKKILEQPLPVVTHSRHRLAAMVLSRSYAALGRKSESAKWKKFAAETGREKLLGNILSSQIRASLEVEQPTEPLTDQELRCLSLSAHGQTSADIALKLGIKPRTVNFHFNKILRKLNAMNRQEAIAKASAANLLKRP
jgi:DNA-binding CsgD family transcriptional regulator